LEKILEIKEVSKIYQSANHQLTVLDKLNFSISLDRATSGSVLLNNIALDTLNEDQRAAVRNQYVGFIFQNFQLLPTLTALENVMVPLELKGAKNSKAIALDLLGKVGLADRVNHYPVQLSGGEQQRVSLARAFSNQPTILFADEPTGNLDAETSEIVIKLLFDLNKDAGTTLIIVTHDVELAAKTNRIIKIKGGQIIADEQKSHA
jgi:putative ABC transport system ATP-binding protein